MWAVAAVATALFVLGPAATAAFGQAEAVDGGDDVQYSAVCQNIIGSIGDITQIQGGTATAVAQQYGDAAAEVAQEQGVSIGQVNECLNGTANPPSGKTPKGETLEILTPKKEKQLEAKVLTASIPDQKVLAATGGMPLPGLAIIGLGLMAAGASLLRFGGWR